LVAMPATTADVEPTNAVIIEGRPKAHPGE
jgi:hypothetical protein